jgi:putative ABC transport system permease protein
VAWRRPVIFKLGLRNIPRRRAQTTLIVVGLMLSTLIVSAALGTGDTLDYSITASAYDVLGHVDEVVVYSQSPDGNADTSLSTKIDASALTVVEDALRDDPRVAGVMPILYEGLPAVNVTRGQSEPDVTLSGVDPNRLEPFGGLIGVDGQPIDLDAIPAGTVVLSEAAAGKLAAKPGDSLMLYYANQPLSLRVAAVAKDSVLSGVLGSGRIGMVVPLARMQEVTGQTGVYSVIAVANTGGVRGGLEHSDGVTETLKTALAGQQLGVDPIKQRVVDDAETVGTIFTDIFLLMGLFSIAAGVLLIVLIFAMLAAERRSEMGMERAVGTQRRQLIQQFVAEGTGYTIVAGMVGAGLGLLAAIGIAVAMKGLFGNDLAISPHVAPRSLVVAYSLGVVITFLAVVIASWRISRLNIVAAVRDLPEASSPKRRRRTLVWAFLLLAFGTMMTVSGVSAEQAFPFYTGLSLIPFGIALVLRYFGVRSRPVFTGVALYLLFVWLTPSSVADSVLGEYEQGMEMFFTSGIFLVLGATLLIVQNTDVLLAGVGKVAGLFRSSLPAVRTAIAYPGAAVGRTGLTIAMFCLIVFSLVMMATMNGNFSNLILGDDAAAGWDVRADQGQANPIADFPAALQANGVDTSGITGYGVVTVPDPAARIRLPGGEWKESPVHGMDDDFIATSTLTFQQRARGYETDEAIVQALRTQPGVAVVDSSAVPNPGSLGADPDLFQLEGVKWEDEVFDPTTIEVTDPRSTSAATLTIIGVIDTKIGSLFGLYANQATIDTIFPTTTVTSYYVKLADSSQAETVAQGIERALLSNGVQAVAIREEMKDAQAQSRAILYLMEGFMALGLIVGVAAVGVIAFRTVVERRQQIGVLRAIGYQRGLVSLSFLIETGFIVGTGVIAGTALGIVLGYNVFHSDQWGSSTASFVIPWDIVAVIVVATVVAAELMAWIPARRAARIAPAEALRYE